MQMQNYLGARMKTYLLGYLLISRSPGSPLYCISTFTYFFLFILLVQNLIISEDINSTNSILKNQGSTVLKEQ